MSDQKELFPRIQKRTQSGEVYSYEPHYNGPAYEPKKDFVRLHAQTDRVLKAAMDRWMTLQEIADETGDPPASISAQLRHLRKPRFGAWTVDKRRRGVNSGLFEYKIMKTEESY